MTANICYYNHLDIISLLDENAFIGPTCIFYLILLYDFIYKQSAISEPDEFCHQLLNLFKSSFNLILPFLSSSSRRIFSLGRPTTTL